MSQPNELSDFLGELSGTLGTGEAKQVREVITIEKWLDSPFYSGDDISGRLYDIWKEEIAHVINNECSEWIATGSLGSGKSTAAETIVIRKLYELSCYEPIPFLFDLMKASVLAYIYFSVSLKQAELTGFGRIRRIIDGIPYFQKYYQRNSAKSSVLEFKSQMVIFGSDVGHQIGTDLFCAILDEANFLDKHGVFVESYSKATGLYSAVLNRRLNRFVIGGKDKGLSVLVSSAAVPTSFVESRILAAKDNPLIHVSNVVAYETRRKHYLDEEFLVFLGTDLVEPLMVESEHDLKFTVSHFPIDQEDIDFTKPFKEVIEELPEEVKLYYKFIPENFRQVFKDNIGQAIKDVIGHARVDSRKLFKSKDAYTEATQNLSIRSPFSRELITLSSNDSVALKDFFDFKTILKPNLPHYFHVDYATVKDMLGFAGAYADSFVKKGELKQPHITVDIMLPIESTRILGDEMPFFKVRDFLFWLREKGLNIALVTFDQFQSTDSIQLLNAAGIKAAKYNLLKSDAEYLTLANTYYERMISHYHNKTYRDELFNLDHDKINHKVDHPGSHSQGRRGTHRGPSNDLVECVAIVVTHAIQHADFSALKMKEYFDLQLAKRSPSEELYNKIRHGIIPGEVLDQRNMFK